MLLPPGTRGSPARRHAQPKGALNTSLCILVANIPIFQGFPILDSARTSKELWRTQHPLRRQHQTEKWVFPTFPTPPTMPVPRMVLPGCWAEPAPRAVPMGSGLLLIRWVLAGWAGSHRWNHSSPWTPLPARPWVAGETGLFIYHQGCDKECERGGEAHGVQCA